VSVSLGFVSGVVTVSGSVFRQADLVWFCFRKVAIGSGFVSGLVLLLFFWRFYDFTYAKLLLGGNLR
jgi:hypothetical protein